MKRSTSKNRCRICLAGDKKLSSIFEKQGQIAISDKIMKIAHITIYDDDTLPHFICPTCLVRLKHCYAFKMMCERSNKVLRKMQTCLIKTRASKSMNKIMVDPSETKTENMTSETVLVLNYDSKKKMVSELKQLPKSEELVLKCKDIVKKIEKQIPECEEPVLCVKSMECSENKECLDSEENFDNNDVHKLTSPAKSIMKNRRRQMHAEQLMESEESNDAVEGDDNTHYPNQRDLHSEKLLVKNEVNAQRQKENEAYYMHEETLPERSELKRKKNMRKPNKKHPSQCHVCDKILSSKDSLVIHMRTHSGVKPYPCTYCKKAFTTLCVRQRHERIHTVDAFYIHLNLVSQTRRETRGLFFQGEKPFSCSTCNKKFAWDSSRAQHERIHSGDNRYKCNLCSMRFLTVAQLSYHRRKHTGERHKCELCEKSYISPGDLSAHVRTKHQSGRQFVCSVCGGAFFRADHLRRHMKLHDIEKSSPAIAKKETPDIIPSSVKHAVERHKHGSCGHLVVSSDDTRVTDHVKTKHQPGRERLHVCSVCGRRFYRPDHLKRHMKSHDSDALSSVLAKKQTPDVSDSSVRVQNQEMQEKIFGRQKKSSHK